MRYSSTSDLSPHRSRICRRVRNKALRVLHKYRPAGQEESKFKVIVSPDSINHQRQCLRWIQYTEPRVGILAAEWGLTHWFPDARHYRSCFEYSYSKASRGKRSNRATENRAVALGGFLIIGALGKAGSIVHGVHSHRVRIVHVGHPCRAEVGCRLVRAIVPSWRYAVVEETTSLRKFLHSQNQITSTDRERSEPEDIPWRRASRRLYCIADWTREAASATLTRVGGY